MQERNCLNFGPFRLDARNQQLWRGQEVIRLTNKALTVLRYLAEHSGQLVTKDDLFAAVWPGVIVSDAALVVCIRELRRALGDERRTPQFIETVHGRGYRFIGVVHAAELAENETRHPPLSPAQDLHEQPPSMALAENGIGQSTPLAVVSLVEPESQPSTVEIQPTPEGSKVHRHWTRRGLILGGVVLLSGVLLMLSVRHLLPLVMQRLSLSTQEAQPPALPLPDKPSIIVLPFVNLSGDPSQEYFSDGITADITSKLSRLSNLFVISRTSAFTYKGKPTKLKEISREMGVQYALEGSVRKTGEHLRITVELIDATTDHPLWTEQYDRSPQNLFAVQDEIVQQIVMTLKLQLTLEERGWIVRKHTDNLEAYDALLHGVEYHWRYTREANTQARQLFEKALALDPQYAEAYAWVGHEYWIEWAFWNPDPQTLERALEMAQKAVALDDSLPFAHSVLSWVYGNKQQSDQALAEGDRALALDPNNADSYARQAGVLLGAGRPEEVMWMMTQAMRLNPHYPPWYLFIAGAAYHLTGRYAEAIARLKDAISRDPNFLPPYTNLASSYCMQWLSQQSPAAQMLEPAVAVLQRALALTDSNYWPPHMALGYVYLYQHQYEQALAEMERAVALGPTEADSYAALAVVLSSVGRTDEALEAAARALRLKSADFADVHLGSIGSAYARAGRYEEAWAVLQRYLSRYPNILPVHLMLAAVYSELGQAAEARAEAAEVLRLNPKFSLEVHRQRMPIKDPAVLERHLAALRKAGLK